MYGRQICPAYECTINTIEARSKTIVTTEAQRWPSEKEAHLRFAECDPSRKRKRFSKFGLSTYITKLIEPRTDGLTDDIDLDFLVDPA